MGSSIGLTMPAIAPIKITLKRLTRCFYRFLTTFIPHMLKTNEYDSTCRRFYEKHFSWFLSGARGSARIGNHPDLDSMNGFYVLGSALGAFFLIAVVRPLYMKADEE